MKINKKIRMILLSTALVFGSMFLTACQDGKNTANSKDQTQTSQEEPTNGEATDKNTQADHEKNSKDKPSQDQSKDQKDISKAKQAKIVYYTYDINTEKLSENTRSVDEVSVGNIVRALIENKVLQPGTEVNSAKVTDLDGVRTLVVDMNDKFVNFDQGATSESLSLRCFANSVVKTFKVDQVKLSVNGKNYSGGHIALKDGEYLKFK